MSACSSAKLWFPYNPIARSIFGRFFRISLAFALSEIWSSLLANGVGFFFVFVFLVKENGKHSMYKIPWHVTYIQKVRLTYRKSVLDGNKKHALAFVQKDIQEQNKKCLSVKKTYRCYSAEVYFSSLEKQESLHNIYFNHIRFKVFFFWVRRRI